MTKIWAQGRKAYFRHKGAVAKWPEHECARGIAIHLGAKHISAWFRQAADEHVLCPFIHIRPDSPKQILLPHQAVQCRQLACPRENGI